MIHINDFILTVEGCDILYKVLFHDELYTFEPQDGGTNQSFSIRRINNDWIPEDSPGETLANQAIKKLDDYLFSQH